MTLAPVCWRHRSTDKAFTLQRRDLSSISRAMVLHTCHPHGGRQKQGSRVLTGHLSLAGD